MNDRWRDEERRRAWEAARDRERYRNDFGYGSSDYDRGREAQGGRPYGEPGYGPDHGPAYRGPAYEQGGYTSDYGRNRAWEVRPDYQGDPRHDYRPEDRSWWDRTRDEVGSWLGDEEAERRRRMDAAREARFHDERRDDTGWHDRFRNERQFSERRPSDWDRDRDPRWTSGYRRDDDRSW